MKLRWSGTSGDEVSWLFMQVIIEVAVSLILRLWAALIVPGTFPPILPDSKENRFVYLVLNGLIYVHTHTQQFGLSISNAVECVQNWRANLISFSFLG